MTHNERISQEKQHKTLHEKYEEIVAKYRELQKKYQKLYYDKRSLDQKNYMKIRGLTKQLKGEIFELNIPVSDFKTNVKNYIESQEGLTITKRSRKTEYIEARAIFNYIVHKYTKESLANIGLFIGGYDHSSIINSLNQCNDWIETDKIFRCKLTKYEGYVIEYLLEKQLYNVI